MKGARHVACMGERRIASGVWVGKPENKTPLGRPKYRWEDNTKPGLQEVEWGRGHGLDSSGSGQVQVAGTCECGNEPSSSIKC